MTNAEFLEKAKKISELTKDDEGIMAMLKEMSDAFQQTSEQADSAAAQNLEARDTDGIPWKEKYEQAVTRYRERFFGPAEPFIKETPTEPEEETQPQLEYATLFKEVGKDAN